MSDPIAAAISQIEKLSDKVDVNRKRVILHVAWHNDLLDVNNLHFAMYDPYTQTDEWVVEHYDEDVNIAVFESGNWLKGEDYEMLDELEGEQAGLQQALSVLRQHVATEECDHSDHIVGPDGTCPECGETPA